MYELKDLEFGFYFKCNEKFFEAFQDRKQQDFIDILKWFTCSYVENKSGGRWKILFGDILDLGTKKSEEWRVVQNFGTWVFK